MISPDDEKTLPARSRSGLTTEVHVDRVQGGDQESFGALYEHLAPALFGWAQLRIHPGVRHQLDPEDLVQEVWWRAMDSFETFDSKKGSFRSWLFKIATNVLLDSFRRLRVRQRERPNPAQSLSENRPQEVVAQATSICKQVVRDESVKSMVAAISNFEPEDRSLFTHCALEGLTVVEAATLVGLSEAAAAKRWQRLKSRIKDSPTWRPFLYDDD